MGTHRKKRRNPAVPPLSWLDRFVYGVGFVGIIALWVLCTVGFSQVQSRIVFSDPQVLAFDNNWTNNLFFLPMCYLLLSLLCLWIIWIELKKPIFGKKGVQYGYPPWGNVYPIFGSWKRAPDRTPNATKRLQEGSRVLFLLWLTVGLILAFCTIPFSLFGRTCLMEDGTIVRYNVLNQPTSCYAIKDISSATWDTAYSSIGHVSGYYTYFVELKTESGDSFCFDCSSFCKVSGNPVDDGLAGMAKLKALIPRDRRFFLQTKPLEFVAKDNEMNGEQVEALYWLFESPIPD